VLPNPADRQRSHGNGAGLLLAAYLNLRRVSLIVFRHNARAINAYRAVGFKKEGLLKKLLFVDDAWVDVVLMAAFRPSGIDHIEPLRTWTKS
jgi:RimJ/RimL family protein N-acetyltransferase